VVLIFFPEKLIFAHMKIFTAICIFLYAMGSRAQVVKLPFNGNTRDTSGNGYHATNYGATLTTDRFNQANSAYAFDGTNDYMTIPSPFDYQYRTVKFWIYLNSVTSQIQAAYTSDNPGLQYGMTTSAMVKSNGDKLRSNAGNSVVENTINTGQWYMVTIAVNNDSFFCYLDSSLVGARVNNKVKSIDGMAKTVIGSSRGGFNSYWGGKIDDITVWNSYLTPAQVKALYKSESQNTTGIATVTPQPVNVYPIPFNQFVCIELPDASDIRISSMTGQLIYSTRSPGGKTEMPTDTLAPGLYVLEVTNKHSAYSRIIIKN
jgi:hypothetical protein